VICIRRSKRVFLVSDSLNSGSSVLVSRIFVGRRQHFGCAVNHLFAVLIDADAVEDHVLVVIELAIAAHRHGQRVAHPYRAAEVQRLVDVDRARSGKLGAQQGGDQRAAPHAVGNDLGEHG
jgi:hypothetical protein